MYKAIIGSYKNPSELKFFVLVYTCIQKFITSIFIISKNKNKISTKMVKPCYWKKQKTKKQQAITSYLKDRIF